MAGGVGSLVRRRDFPRAFAPEAGGHDSFDLVKRLAWVLLLAVFVVVRLFPRSPSAPLRQLLPAWLLLGWSALAHARPR